MNYNPLYRTDQPKSQTQPTTNGRTIKDFLLHSDPICARCRDSYKIINDESNYNDHLQLLCTTRNLKKQNTPKKIETFVNDSRIFGYCDECELYLLSARGFAQTCKKIQVFCSVTECRKNYNLNVSELGPNQIETYISLVRELMLIESNFKKQNHISPLKEYEHDPVKFGFCPTCAENQITKFKLLILIEKEFENLLIKESRIQEKSTIQEKWTIHSQSKSNIFSLIDYSGSNFRTNFFTNLKQENLLDHFKNLQNGLNKI